MKQPIPFGKYYLLERVNVGGMAEVFKAKATGVEGFERLVAVKRILPSIAEDEEFITMFVDEAKIAVQLTHANIAQIFDLGRVEGSFFIALEYVSGKDLRAMWNRTRQRGELLPVPLSCYAIMKVCEGLDYAHNKHDSTGVFLNLVHRDVSPQNVLISYEGEVKIIDFGIAKAAGKVGRTQAGILKGKFGYMSPEQVLGLEIDRRSDVFGVGICLYELLTGERLFVAETDFATLEKVRSVDIMPPSTYNRRIPEELEQIVMRALARDRDLRYQTAMQLHDELQAFMHTSGNLFSRKDLSAYMHRVFAEEIEKETARDHEYAQLDPAAGSGENNDLAAFDAIDPVSTVSALSEQPSYPFVEAASMAGAGPMPEPRNRKATLLGIPAAAVVRAPSVPRLVPSPASVPPLTSSRPPVALTDSGANMWDDDELSTQIYDKPDYDRTPLPSRHGGDDDDDDHADDGDDDDDGLESLQASVPEGVVPSAEPYQRPQNGGAPRAPRSHVATLQLPAQPQLTAAAIPDPYTRKRGAQKGHPMLVAVFAVIAIIACIVLGLLLFGEREPATVNISTTPTRVSVSVDGRLLGTSSSPFVIGELSAGKRHDITISSPGFRPWSQAVELKAGEVLSLPSVQLVRIDTGFALSSEPSGAAVLVDGKALPDTTPVRVVDLAPGDHVVRLEKQGYAAWESPFHANVGTVLPLPNVSLQPLAPSEPAVEAPQRPSWSSTHSWHRGSWSSSHGSNSSSSSTSSTEPSSNDEPSTPEPEPAPAHEESAASRTPAPSASTSVVDDLLNEPTAPAEHATAPAAHGGGTGKLRVNSRPWSQVFVDGKAYGPTPRMNIVLPEGSHTLKLVNDEFSVTKTVEVNITAGKTETVVLNLVE